ncbi:SRPBCC family protein [Planomonospora parontospora]|uniref:SRPBCC family protein n=1 Tax=Planomonospora parontospora TaxID=58119 RepID=UPI001943202D|nr:SRPBCC family protein [Planomonospora parontospora]GGL54227.1 polyketide cyclase [Planomonospora parontospora subsp. antibiotica]GII19715.1 polyketide cyclase [Planomonospora parontospora subsp. antibiotica]
MTKTRISVSCDAAAGPERVFAVLTDWPRHDEWMILTRAHVAAGDGRSAGSRLAAFTGVGPLGFLDTMEITRWDPPAAVEVRHTGRLVRGKGVFRVLPREGGGSTIVWEEELDLPFGAMGRLGWPLLRPLNEALFRLSLRRLAELSSS